MLVSCAYSFDDLFEAVHARTMTDKERSWLYGLSQDKRNQQVGQWAKQSNWQTEERIGSDGVTYLAFWPRAKELNLFRHSN